LDEVNPGLDPWIYCSTLGDGTEMLDVAARGAGVDLWRFYYNDPEDFEDVLPFLELSEAETRQRREKLAAQIQWHPIPEGIGVFKAMIAYLEEHPDVLDPGWLEPLVGAMRTVVLGMEAALEQGETGFHLDIG
jgi:hypothetical protein